MNKPTLVILFSLMAHTLLAQWVMSSGSQFTVGSNTVIAFNGSIENLSATIDFRPGSTLALTGTNQILKTSQTWSLPRLRIEGGGVKTLEGSFLISEELVFGNGLIHSGTNLSLNALVLGPGASSTGSDANSYVIGPLAHQGGGTKYFPIGTDTRFTPLTLYDVAGTSGVVTGLIAREQDGSNLPQSLPEAVDSVSQSWFWSFTSGGLSNAIPELPVLSEDAPVIGGNNKTGVVLEVDPISGLATNLGGASDVGRVRGASSITGPTSNLMIGSSLIIIPLIRNLITLNNDGQNDFLVIDNLDVYRNNEVILLDRWGTEVFRKTGFANYDAITNPYDGSLDFLESGNYICIVKYAGRSAKQVITVLK